MSTHTKLQLRHQRPFIKFWFARVFTASGFQMLAVAIGWHMYELTGSVLDLGLVGLAEFFPACCSSSGPATSPTDSTGDAWRRRAKACKA